MRVNVGEREYVYARVVRSVRREEDKWIDFCWRLLIAERVGKI